MPDITWMHLSDLHMGCRGKELWWRARRDFQESISEYFKYFRQIDMILVTGDLTNSAQSEQFKMIDDFLDDLRGWLRKEGQETEPLVIPVPGNHDVTHINLGPSSATGSPGKCEFYSLDNFSRDRKHEFVQNLERTLWEEDDATFFDPLFDAYNKWLQKSILPALQARPEVKLVTSHFPGDLSVFLNLPDRPPVTVVGLNSAWIQYKKGDFYKQIEMFPQQLDYALNKGAPGSPLDALKGRVNLLLMHHPPAWLSDEAEKRFSNDIYNKHFHLCLHGHMHESEATYQLPINQPRYYFQAPSLFGLAHYGMPEMTRAMGYVWGRLDQRCHVWVWPLKHDEHEKRFIRDTRIGEEEKFDGIRIRPVADTDASPVTASMLRTQYNKIVCDEFSRVLERKSTPSNKSPSSLMLYGHFETDEAVSPIVQLSRASLFLDTFHFVAATTGGYRVPEKQDIEDNLYHVCYLAANCRWRALVSAIASGMEEYNPRVLLDPLIDAIVSTKPEKNIGYRLPLAAKRYTNMDDDEDYEKYIEEILRNIGYLCRDVGLTLKNLVDEETMPHRLDSPHHQGRIEVSTSKLAPRYIIRLLINDAPGSYDAILNALATAEINIIQSYTKTLLQNRVAGAQLLVNYTGRSELDQVLKKILYRHELKKYLLFIDHEHTSRDSLGLKVQIL